MRGGMGYDLFGVNVPSLSEIAQAAAGGAGSAITASAASSPGVQAAAKTATGNVIGNWILAHWKTVALGVVVVSAGVYILGKKSKRI